MASKWGEVGLESGSSPTWSRVKRDKQYSVTRVHATAHLQKAEWSSQVSTEWLSSSTIGCANTENGVS
jgi:hypothetical protein